jgi:glycerate-2-kinase
MQSIQRLQVGVFGLCTMLMIVGLANIIMERAKLTAEPDPIADVVVVDAAPKKQATDPLANIGVVPSADPTPSESASESAEDLLEPAPLP